MTDDGSVLDFTSVGSTGLIDYSGNSEVISIKSGKSSLSNLLGPKFYLLNPVVVVPSGCNFCFVLKFGLFGES